jgi:hypothetical protein
MSLRRAASLASPVLRRAYSGGCGPGAVAPKPSLASLREQLAHGPDFGDFVRGRAEYAVAAPTPKVRAVQRRTDTSPPPVATWWRQYVGIERA